MPRRDGGVGRCGGWRWWFFFFEKKKKWKVWKKFFFFFFNCSFFFFWKQIITIGLGLDFSCLLLSGSAVLRGKHCSGLVFFSWGGSTPFFFYRHNNNIVRVRCKNQKNQIIMKRRNRHNREEGEAQGGQGTFVHTATGESTHKCKKFCCGYCGRDIATTGEERRNLLAKVNISSYGCFTPQWKPKKIENENLLPPPPPTFER